MRRLKLGWLIGALALIVVGAAAQHTRLFERAWFKVTEWQHAPQWRERSLWLGDYRVQIEAQPIEGLSNLSALTFDPSRQSLFTLSNNPAQLIELDLNGRVLRQIDLQGFGDPEAVEYIEPGVLVIADERRQSLYRLQLDETTTQISAKGLPQLTLGMGRNGNKGFEGLAWDAAGQRLWVAKERDPLQIFEVRGFPHTQRTQSQSLTINSDPERDARLFVRDLSSLDFDAPTGHLLVLSDESRLLLELSREGEPVSSLSLLRGQQGLSRSVPQPEGLASDDQGHLYLISEPNLFYRFSKPASP